MSSTKEKGGAKKGPSKPSTPSVSTKKPVRVPSGASSEGATRFPVATPSDGAIPPNRPGYGTLGTRLEVLINFFPITIPEITIHQYDVKIYNMPEGKLEEKERRPIVNRYVCRSVMNALSGTSLKEQYPAYDGRAIMYCKNALSPLNYSVVWVDKEDGGRERNHVVELQHAAHVDLSLISEITMRQFQFQNKLEHDAVMDKHQAATNAIDAIFRQFAAGKYTPIGRDFYWYSNKADFDLGHELELWEGYTQSVRPGHKQVYLNLNVSYRPVIKPMNLLEFLMEVLDLKYYDELCDQGIMWTAGRELLNLEIISKHLKTQRKYKITKKTMFLKPANKESFLCEGNNITVHKYFKFQYKIDLKRANLPCIDVGRGDKVVALPMEVCFVKEGQLSKKEMNTTQRRNMIQATSVLPSRRQTDISDMAYDMLPPKDPLRAFYGIKTDDRMKVAECRQLSSPDINYKGSIVGKPRQGKWQIGGRQLVNPVPVHVWAIVHFTFSRDRFPYPEFINKIRQQADDKGIFMDNPVNEREIANFKSDLSGGLGDVHGLLKYTQDTFGRDLQLIFCIIDRRLKSKSFNSDDVYNRIKLVGDTQLSVVTQCIDQRSAKEMQGSTLGGVCLKMNAKLGGTNHYATIPLLADTMIMGADVNHPKPGPSADEMPSIAVACVALDTQISQYFSTCRFQVNRNESKQRQEIILDFESMCYDLLREYTRNNGSAKKILFYRDGVSESQFQFCLDQEMPALQRACLRLAKDYRPKITLVCVQKRHHMRMFELSHDNRVNNIPPGTYLDHSITHPYEYDFYLCSHAALKGTARSSHYHVLYDEIQYSPNELYSVTNQLCYCFSRCTKSVSIPPPVYYADLIAYRYQKYFDAYRKNTSAGKDPTTDWDYYRKKVGVLIGPGKMYWA